VRIPHFSTGQWPTEDQKKAVEAYRLAYPNRLKPGTILNAAVINEAVDWFNFELATGRAKP
jgi:hypothetical protein